MSNPSIQLVGPNSGTQTPLVWDMANTFWDSGLFWDAFTYIANKLIPSIGKVSDAVDIGVV